MDPHPPCKKWTYEDEYYLTKLKTYAIPIGDTELVRQKAVARIHIDGAVDNTHKQERKALRRRLDLMDSECVVVETGDSM